MFSEPWLNTWIKDCRRSLAQITTLFNAQFICPLRQLAMSSINIAILVDKDGEVLGIA